MKFMFFNIDTLNDFMNPDGALYVPNSEMIKPTLGSITTFALVNAVDKVDICDHHDISDKEISNNPDYKMTFPPHAIKNTYGSMLIEETESRVYRNRKSQLMVYKSQFDVFDGDSKNEIEIILDRYDPDAVIVYGVAADICVDKAVNGLLKRLMSTIVVSDAISSINKSRDNDLIMKWINDGVIVANWYAVRELVGSSL